MMPDERKKILDGLFAEREQLEGRIASLERQAASGTDDQSRRLRLEIGELRAEADRIGRRWSELQDDDVHDDDRGGIER